MKFVDEYQDNELAGKIASEIATLSTIPIKLMEFCGGHTHAIMRYGLRQLLPENIEMRSGPGCPVCVTANADLDKAIALSLLPNTIVTTFGDMIRVPGSYSSLQQARARGADIRIVYSTTDALEIARNNPGKAVIFIGIGFETTAPTVAAAILRAQKEGIENFSVLSCHKLTPPVIRALLESGEVKIDGIICPGHVCVITGSRPYEFISREYKIACAISGFEPLDILLCVYKLVKQIENGSPRMEIAYSRAIKPEGNKPALKLMNEVFEPADTVWRGIGTVPCSGLRIKATYQCFDAAKIFKINMKPARENKACRCGDILRATATPVECPLFGKACTPEKPIGPCMVSSEGACAAYYQYRRPEKEHDAA